MPGDLQVIGLPKIFIAVPALFCTILSLCFILSSPACAAKRVALVIGNSAYQNVPRLENPKNDAALFADTLRGLGFTLIGNGAQLDLNKPDFDAAIQTFGNELQAAECRSLVLRSRLHESHIGRVDKKHESRIIACWPQAVLERR